MGRKATIIKHLKMMGYSVGEDGGGLDVTVVTIGLRTNTGKMFFIAMYPEDFEKDFIVETIVSKFNEMLVKEC